MTDQPKTINRSTYLQALGLYTLGHRYNQKADECGDELAKLLGFEGRDDSDAGHIVDALWGERPFDEALKLSGITIADDPKL